MRAAAGVIALLATMCVQPLRAAQPEPPPPPTITVGSRLYVASAGLWITLDARI